MEFVYLGADGQPEPVIVPDVMTQVARVFARLEAQALQAACPVQFRGFEELSPEEPMAQCLRCQSPMDPVYVDEHGICDECHLRHVHGILHTPPFLRTEKDVKLLVALGYVDADEYTI